MRSTSRVFLTTISGTTALTHNPSPRRLCGVPAGTGGQASDDALRPYLIAGLALFAAGATLMVTKRRATVAA